jgi:hypothetical protein
MIQQAGVCVFICGLKEDAGGGAPVVADGVLQEFEAAQRLGRVVVPVGASGGAASEIWNRIDRSRALPQGLSRRDFDALNEAGQSSQALAKIIGKAIAASGKAGRRGAKAPVAR